MYKHSYKWKTFPNKVKSAFYFFSNKISFVWNQSHVIKVYLANAQKLTYVKVDDSTVFFKFFYLMKEVSKKYVAMQRNNVPKFTVPPTNVELGSRVAETNEDMAVKYTKSEPNLVSAQEVTLHLETDVWSWSKKQQCKVISKSVQNLWELQGRNGCILYSIHPHVQQHFSSPCWLSQYVYLLLNITW